MAVRCEFIDVIIPLANIDRVFPGGFSAFKTENAALFGGRLWHDDYLLRDGAMNPTDAKDAIAFWERYGLIAMDAEDGRQRWRDVCVVEHVLGGPTLPCDWIEFDSSRQCVYLKGQAPDPVVGREHFSRAQ
jgi:hypothetical protein